MQTTVGVAILNYQRAENVPSIIEALQKQTLVPRIVVWNNGESRTFSGVDWQIESSLNIGCISRWHALSMLNTDYVMCIDDDLLPEDPNLIQNCITACRKYGNNRIVGVTGKTLGKGPRFYRDGISKSANSERDEFVDIVKGRFMILPTTLLERVPIVFPSYQGRGDDIWISLLTSTSSEHHVLARCTKGAFRQLPQFDAALCKQPDHSLKRDLVVSRLMEQKRIDWRTPTLGTKLKGLVLAFGYRVRGYRDHRLQGSSKSHG